MLSHEAKHAPLIQLAVDMLARLGTAAEEIVEVLLSRGQLVDAIRLVFFNLYNRWRKYYAAVMFVLLSWEFMHRKMCLMKTVALFSQIVCSTTDLLMVSMKVAYL